MPTNKGPIFARVIRSTLYALRLRINSALGKTAALEPAMQVLAAKARAYKVHRKAAALLHHAVLAP